VQLPAGEEADKMSDSGQLFRPFRAGGFHFPLTDISFTLRSMRRALDLHVSVTAR